MFGAVPEQDVLQHVIDRMPEALDKNGKDRRAQYARSALQKLSVDGSLTLFRGNVTLPDDVGDLL